MKFNWGYKILFLYLSFVAGILFLVFKANGERYDLVTEDYYGAELKYQEIIDQKKRVDALSSQPQVSHSEKGLSVVFPAELKGKVLKGECYLYKPSDERMDQRQSFSTTDGTMQMNFTKPSFGMYDLKLTWEMNGQIYFMEKKIFL